MNALSALLTKIEQASPTQRDKGTTFEKGSDAQPNENSR